MADVSEIRRVLQVYDQIALMGPSQAVRALTSITNLVSKQPAAYDLTGDGDAWQSAGGNSYCDADSFPSKLAALWVEVLRKDDFANAGFDKDELTTLKAKLTGWGKRFESAELDFESEEDLGELLDDLIAAAPAASDDDDSSDEEEGAEEDKDKDSSD